jgi:hypothetical protein
MDGFTPVKILQYQLKRRMDELRIWLGYLGGGEDSYVCQNSKPGLFSPWSSLYTGYVNSVTALLFCCLNGFM